MDEKNNGVNYGSDGSQDSTSYGTNPVDGGAYNYGANPIDGGSYSYGDNPVDGGSYSYAGNQANDGEGGSVSESVSNVNQQYGDSSYSGGQSYQNPQYNSNMQYNSSTGGSPHPVNIAALVCGILGIIGYCFLFAVPFLIPALAISGIFLGILGKKYPGAGLGKAGFICGIVGCVIFLLIILLCLIGAASLLSFIDKLNYVTGISFIL